MGYTTYKKTRGMTTLVKWLTYHNLLRLRALLVRNDGNELSLNGMEWVW